MARKKKIRLNIIALLIVIAASCALIAGCYYWGEEPARDTPPVIPVTPKPRLTDYSRTADNIRAQVDEILKNNNVAVKQTSLEEKSRESETGAIVWTERSILLILDRDGSIEELTDQLNRRLPDEKARLMPLEHDAWNGQDAERLDIVLLEPTEEETPKLIIDRLYFIPSPLPAPPYTPPVRRSGKLAVVIDDCGYNMDAVNKMTALRQNFSFAIIPYREFSQDALKRINSMGKEALLHLPMEPLDRSQQSEKTTISPDMSDSEIQKITGDALAQLPGVTGANNHQGSRATADERVMRAVLSVIKSRRLFFLDSNTQPKTIAHKVAGQLGVKTGLNRAFLDGKADVEYIKERMRQAGESALENGAYIAICHARPHTVTALTEMAGELEKMGVEFVFVSDLLK